MGKISVTETIHCDNPRIGKNSCTAKKWGDGFVTPQRFLTVFCKYNPPGGLRKKCAFVMLILERKCPGLAGTKTGAVPPESPKTGGHSYYTRVLQKKKGKI